MASDARSPINITPGVKLADLCTLTPAQLAERRAWVDREIAPHARGRLQLENGVAWDFDASPETRERLERLAELERKCCGPADLEFSVCERGDDSLRFEIRGANAAALANAIDSEAEAPRVGRAARIAKTAGLAGFGAVLVCCIVPIGVATLAGAAVAGPLLKLDDPLVIGSVAAVFGIGMWQFEKRRGEKRKLALET
jgi:hypothetical protein